MGQSVTELATPSYSMEHRRYTELAFQVHEPGSMAEPTPSTVPAAKTKRKRTSPQDHAILEAAYLRNSKPDKAERAAIVTQVDLNEKEVQIWFQNRRQNDRRRSKPLQPHEVVAHLRNSVGSPAPPSTTLTVAQGDTASGCLPPIPGLMPLEMLTRPLSRASSIHNLLNPTSSAETQVTHDVSATASQGSLGAATPPSSLESQAAAETNPAAVDTVLTHDTLLEEGAPGTDHGSGRKRDHAEMMKGRAVPSISPESRDDATPGRDKEPLKRSGSMVRLAMTAEGAVKIRTNNEPTPSPEKPQAAAPAAGAGGRNPLSRSRSSFHPGEVFRDANQGAQAKPGFGRSRDARTWEFYCDSSPKAALSTQAEAETAGSAVGAINLLRSNSFKSRSPALSPAMSKANARVIHDPNGRKPKFARAKSSLGRLQGAATVLETKGKPQHRAHVRSPSGDSDKENWAPGTQLSDHPLRRTQASGVQRPILGDNHDVLFPDAHVSHTERAITADTGRSPSKDKNSAKGEDLDCIQGLLSLSQGAWK